MLSRLLNFISAVNNHKIHSSSYEHANNNEKKKLFYVHTPSEYFNVPKFYSKNNILIIFSLPLYDDRITRDVKMRINIYLENNDNTSGIIKMRQPIMPRYVRTTLSYRAENYDF